MAQLGRALRSGRRGRRFESCHFDFSFEIGRYKTSNKNLKCYMVLLLKKGEILYVFYKE